MGRFADILGTLGTSFGIGPKASRAVLDASALTAPRTHALPDKSGTLALTSDLYVVAPSPDYISGLKLSYVDANHVQVGTGAWADPASGQLVQLTAATTKQPGAGTLFWHLYGVFTGAVEISSTAPAAPYFGTARSHPTVSGRRYLGSVLAQTSSLVPFTMIGTKMRYLTLPMVAPFRVLSAGTALTSTTVDLSGVLPSTARIAHARVLNTATQGQVYIGNSDMGAASLSNYMTTARPMTEFETELLTDSSQAINYIYNQSPGTGCNIDVNGYEFER